MRRTAALSTAVFALLAMTATPVFGWADHEGSNRPQDIFTDPIEDTFEDGFLSERCGAPIETHVEGQVRTRYTYNRGLDIQFDTHTSVFHGTWTNTETGDSVSFVGSGSDRLAFEVLPNGDYTGVVTRYESRNFKATVPGEGPVLSSGGRAIVYEVNEIIDPETFWWELISSEQLFASGRESVEDLDALCEALTAST